MRTDDLFWTIFGMMNPNDLKLSGWNHQKVSFHAEFSGVHQTKKKSGIQVWCFWPFVRQQNIKTHGLGTMTSHMDVLFWRLKAELGTSGSTLVKIASRGYRWAGPWTALSHDWRGSVSLAACFFFFVEPWKIPWLINYIIYLVYLCLLNFIYVCFS